MSGFSETDRAEVDAQETADRAEIDRLLKEGHTEHCVWRLLVGDGQCECSIARSER